MTNTTNTERLKDVLRSALTLCEWIGASPHQRGSINGQASQVAHNIRAALAEAEGRAVPQGWKWVPVEPTPKMAQALIDYKGDEEMQWPRNVSPNFALAAYRIMLAASPKAPATAVAQVPYRCDTPRYCTSVQRCTADDGRQAAAPEAPAAPAVVEPAAWMWRNTKTDARGVYFEDPAKFFDLSVSGDYEWGPLYAHPPAPREPAIPRHLDVRTILLDVVPGDGDGHEIYATCVSDVDNKLAELWERLDSTPAPREPLTDEQIDALDSFALYWMAPRQRESVRAFARAIERKLAEKWGVAL